MRSLYLPSVPSRQARCPIRPFEGAQSAQAFENSPRPERDSERVLPFLAANFLDAIVELRQSFIRCEFFPRQFSFAAHRFGGI